MAKFISFKRTSSVPQKEDKIATVLSSYKENSMLACFQEQYTSQLLLKTIKLEQVAFNKFYLSVSDYPRKGKGKLIFISWGACEKRFLI